MKQRVSLMAELGNILMVIPARGGSKRLPKKNVLPLAGKPLICWTIEAALGTDLDASILVTSDNEDILKLASKYVTKGVISYKRPANLATDTTSTAEVLVDALGIAKAAGYEANTIILLQPTSPLRSVSDIVSAVRLFENMGCNDTVVSVCEVDHPTAWVGTIAENDRLQGVDLSGQRSQDYRKEYCLNGAVYVASVDVLQERGTLFTDQLRACVMPRERSIDIDEAIDFRVCESMLQSQ